eukprot:9473380-Pyramimonas_sp.AAC.1
MLAHPSQGSWPQGAPPKAQMRARMAPPRGSRVQSSTASPSEGPHGATAECPNDQVSMRPTPILVHASHVSRPKWLRSHGAATPISARSSHGPRRHRSSTPNPNGRVSMTPPLQLATPLTRRLHRWPQWEYPYDTAAHGAPQPCGHM